MTENWRNIRFNHYPFISSFCHIAPPESFVMLANIMLANICKDKERNLGPVAGYYKTEIIQSKLHFCFACVLPEVTISLRRQGF